MNKYCKDCIHYRCIETSWHNEESVQGRCVRDTPRACDVDEERWPIVDARDDCSKYEPNPLKVTVTAEQLAEGLEFNCGVIDTDLCVFRMPHGSVWVARDRHGPDGIEFRPSRIADVIAFLQQVQRFNESEGV